MQRHPTRHPTRHPVRRRALLGVAAGLLLAGCGSTGGVRAVPPAAGSSGSAADCGDVVLDLSAGDVPGDICLNVGSTVRLRYGAGAQAAQESGAALAEVSDGLYRGARPGDARFSGFRRACPPDPGKGKVSCLAITSWSVTVHVRR